MVYIDVLKPYIIQLDNQDIRMIENEIKNLGAFKAFESHFKYLDCSRIRKDGLRMQQTIGYPYCSEMSSCLYIAEHYLNTTDYDDDKCYQRLVDIHNKNLEFELENPPILYDKKKGKKQWEKNKAKMTKKTTTPIGKIRDFSKLKLKLTPV